ncbi:hypothetical protein ACOMHN_024335 [Nucella lapillus]
MKGSQREILLSVALISSLLPSVSCSEGGEICDLDQEGNNGTFTESTWCDNGCCHDDNDKVVCCDKTTITSGAIMGLVITGLLVMTIFCVYLRLRIAASSVKPPSPPQPAFFSRPHDTTTIRCDGTTTITTTTTTTIIICSGNICCAGNNTAPLCAGNNTATLCAGNNTAPLCAGNNTTTLCAGNNTATLCAGNNTALCAGNNTATLCAGNNTATLCAGNNTTTLCAGNNTTTLCAGNNTATLCAGNNTTTLCAGNNTATLCAGNNTTTLCTGNNAALCAVCSYSTASLHLSSLRFRERCRDCKLSAAGSAFSGSAPSAFRSGPSQHSLREHHRQGGGGGSSSGKSWGGGGTVVVFLPGQLSAGDRHCLIQSSGNGAQVLVYQTTTQVSGVIPLASCASACSLSGSRSPASFPDVPETVSSVAEPSSQASSGEAAVKKSPVNEILKQISPGTVLLFEHRNGSTVPGD